MAQEGASRGNYRALLHVPAYPWLVSAVMLSRLANAMSQITVVIYLLERTGSPALAGAGAAAQLLPAIATGPLAGAWLDRVASRSRLVAATQTIRGSLLAALVLTGELVNPPGVVYLVILAGLGVTFPLPNPGFRSLVPLLVPRPLWTAANALDSVSFDVSYVVGPALAAVMTTVTGAALAILVQAAVTYGSALAASRVREPAGRPRSGERTVAAALTGLRAVVSHRELRATMVLMFVSGIGYGVLTVALPLWVRDQLGHAPGASGWMWAAFSIGSIAGGLAYGARRPRGSDSRHGVLFMAVAGLPLLVVPLVSSLPAGMACMTAAGLASAPAVLAMFSIRQTAVPPELHGRTFAITVSVNVAGGPAGAMLAGFLVGPLGVHMLLFAAGAAQLSAAAVTVAMLAGVRRRAPAHAWRVSGS
jgi:MFS family permease